MVAREAGKYLAVIDHVLALGRLRPELRKRVVRMQRRLIQMDLNNHYPTGEAETG